LVARPATEAKGIQIDPEDKVSILRQRLAAKAKQEPGFRFYVLYVSTVKSIEQTGVISSEHPQFGFSSPASAGIGAASAAPPYQFSLTNQAADANSAQGRVWETRSVFQAEPGGVDRLWTRRAPRMGVACGPGGRARGPFREAKSSRQSISLSMPPHPPRREGRDLVAIDASAPGLLSGWRRRQAPGPSGLRSNPDIRFSRRR
jgi:hypothetical protein